MNSYHHSDEKLDTDSLMSLMVKIPHKMNWFMERGYEPHYFQIIFHGMWNEGEDRLKRFRHLVAGRRGGKTLSAAWETLFYAVNPKHFHWDAHRVVSDNPLHVWILTPDYRSSGRAALFTMRDVLRKSGLVAGKDFQENRSEKWIEFSNGSMVEYKTAERPEQLVGAGLDLLWLDEGAVVPSDDAWNVARPALSDKQGLVLGTTTPRGKNWYYEMFFSDKARENPDIGRVEYRSIDNPYFLKKEWELQLKEYHPLLFKREYMASFDAFAGVELQGDWLQYYEFDDIPLKTDGSYDLLTYIGVDPAVSLSNKADKFAMALIGVGKGGDVYLLELFSDRIDFPTQLEKVMDWYFKHRPAFIGVESNAYQAALSQQLSRMENLPPIFPIYSKGSKVERILSMAPMFRMGKIKIRREHVAFIDEWINYNSKLKNPDDDCLDAVEIALRAGGALLPEAPVKSDFESLPATSMQELADRSVSRMKRIESFDPDLGGEW